MLRRSVLVGVFALGCAVPSAHAAVITLNNCGTLATVIENGCTVGDKSFTNVTWQAAFNVDAAAQVASIEVVGITYDDLSANFGIRLQGIGGAPLPEVPNVIGEDFLYATLRFDVSVLDPSAYLITDMHLAMDATAGVLGTVVARVEDENGVQLGGTLCVEATAIECRYYGTPNAQFGPRTQINVETGLGLDTENGQVNYIDQIITQQAQVPEPATLLLLGTGLLGAGVRRWRQKHT